MYFKIKLFNRNFFEISIGKENAIKNIEKDVLIKRTAFLKPEKEKSVAVKIKKHKRTKNKNKKENAYNYLESLSKKKLKRFYTFIKERDGLYKKCSKCKEKKPIREFNLRNFKKRSLQTYCKLCINKINKDRNYLKKSETINN